MPVKTAVTPSIDYQRTDEPIACPLCSAVRPPVRVGPAVKCGGCGNLLMIGQNGKYVRFVPAGEVKSG